MNKKITCNIYESNIVFKKPPSEYKHKSMWDSPQDHFHYAINSKWHKTISLILSSVLNTTFDFYKKYNYLPVCLPITCGSVSSPIGLGSDSVPVKISLFNEEIYLADSMQFQLEYQLRQGFDGVFYIMPSFRGEDPDARHLNQFFHSEAEIKGGLDDVINLVENYIKNLSQDVCNNLSEEISDFANSLDHIEKIINPNYTFPRIRFDDAVKLLGSNSEYFKHIDDAGIAITNKGEKMLIQHFDGPVWLTHFPALTVPFYQAYDKHKPSNTLTADLLMGIGETVGCGERHTNFHELETALNEHQVDKQHYEWYIQLKEIYPMQTSGFGLGIERFILWIMKHNDIRDIPLISRLKGVKPYV